MKNHSKVDEANLVSFLNQTPIFCSSGWLYSRFNSVVEEYIVILVVALMIFGLVKLLLKLLFDFCEGEVKLHAPSCLTRSSIN